MTSAWKSFELISLFFFLNFCSNERGERAWTYGEGPMLKLPLVKEKIEIENFDFFFVVYSTGQREPWLP